ncbi:Pkinase-domain-containing protein [Dendrothele bispora CBS 962.96]|uniref:Serine/threonine-protein kinase n=1 Tax=Dendrothele bispora (strain CBS 962.96) TaxID=1314807 RepID=A0A4S8MPQ2_DENBC|nr:Pkinase-domain-containing protein [Dendrothele bispora CBS 962.96]
MSAQVYSAHRYASNPVVTARRYPLAPTTSQQNQPVQTTPQKPQKKQKQPGSPPLPRQNTKTAPPSPPRVISDPTGHLQFHRVGFLGEGGFARVYEVKDTRGARLACKVVTKSSLVTKKAKTKLYAEIKIHRALEHPNIVDFRDCFEDDDNVYMTLELCVNGSITDMLRRRRLFTEPEARFFLVQLIGACQYMHTHQVIHRDLKLGNLFLDGHMNVKVGDFGLAALIENPGERKKTICGTPNYIAPEVLFDTANGHSFEVDIWSIGVILYTLVVGRPPFQTKDVKAIYERIRDNQYEFPADRPISAYAQELIQSILASNPQMRPSLLDIVDHPFFTRGIFPPYIPSSAYDIPPNFRSMTRAASEANLKRVRRNALLDEDQITTIAVPRSGDVPSSASSTTSSSNAPTSYNITTSIAQQEKEFQKAVQPGSPISALLNSAKRPLMMSTTNADQRANSNGVKESPLYRKLQAASSTNASNPSPLRQSVTAQASRTQVRGLQEITEEANDERTKKELMTRKKELEAQKARIVAQMAPVREEEKEDVEMMSPKAMLPVKKEVRRPSVKENRVPAQAPIAPPRTKQNIFETAAQVLTLAFDAKAEGRVFNDPRKLKHLPLPEEKVFIASWVDYCNRFGLGYALTDGTVGLHFNDTTSLVLSADKRHLDYITTRKNGNVDVRRSYRVNEIPGELSKKLELLKHIEAYIMGRLYGNFDYCFENKEKTEGMTCIQMYYRLKKVFVFRLSHDVVQFNFSDHTKMILSTHALVITYIDKTGTLTRWTLAEIMKLSLEIARGDHAEDGPAPLTPEETSFNQKLVDKLRYCKEVLLSIDKLSHESGATAGSTATVTATASGGSGSGHGLTASTSSAAGLGRQQIRRQAELGSLGSLGMSTKTSKASLR